MRLSSKVAVVTGSSRGIGRAIVERLGHEGARLVVNGRDPASVEAAAADLRAMGLEARGVAADVATDAGARALFEEAARVFGPVDVLVNNAGWAVPVSHILDMDEDHWDTVLRVNLKSVFLCTRLAATQMVDAQRAGSIVNISSFGAARSHRNMAAHDAAKSGVEAFTRSVALDLAPFGIRVNAVGPGIIPTGPGMTDPVSLRRAEIVPLGRVGTTDEIAGAVAFLASGDASYMTGQTLYIDGGVLAQLRPPGIDQPLPASVGQRGRLGGRIRG